MSCQQDIERLVIKAEDAILAGNSYDQFRRTIHNAVSNCSEFGDSRSRTNLVRIIDDHLYKLGLHAESRMKSWSELVSRDVPPQEPIKDFRRPW